MVQEEPTLAKTGPKNLLHFWQTWKKILWYAFASESPTNQIFVNIKILEVFLMLNQRKFWLFRVFYVESLCC